MVMKGEDQEQTLYAKVRNAEYSRQQQEQNVRRVQLQLQELKRKNAAAVTQELASVNAKEMELEQQLIREKAELDKVRGCKEYKRRGFAEAKVKLANSFKPVVPFMGQWQTE